jgi:endonuclease G
MDATDPPAPVPFELQRVAETPKPPSHFAGRTGYDAAFLGPGAIVELPRLADPVAADAARLADGSTELRYQHFSTMHSRSRRLPLLAACNLDGAQRRSLPRHDTWSYDGRLPIGQQMLREAYGPQQEGKFSRGHMARRQDPVWGSADAARQANIDTFCATNACPQWQDFNGGLWGALEDHLLDNAVDDRKRLSVFTGPVLRADDPVRFGVAIPLRFWKVVAFVSLRTGALSAIAYVMSQAAYLQKRAAGDPGDVELSQRPLAYVERETGLRFESLAGRDARPVDPGSVGARGALGAEGTEAWRQAIRRVEDTLLP